MIEYEGFIEVDVVEEGVIPMDQEALKRQASRARIGKERFVPFSTMYNASGGEKTARRPKSECRFGAYGAYQKRDLK